MEFWGVEVKGGQPFSVEAEEGRFLHLSQACLGEVKDKGNEPVYLYVTVNEKKLVLGTLSSEKFPQQQLDLLFNHKFELSHSWKKGSVYFYGYRRDNPTDEIENDSEDGSEEESLARREIFSATQNARTAKPDSSAAKQTVKIIEPKKDEKNGNSEDDSDTDASEDESDSQMDEDSDSDSESGKGEAEETPKIELMKKRPAVAATETLGRDKKAKFITPQKTETKKGGVHVDTPHPLKHAAKTPANHSKQQTTKPAGSHLCKPCNRSFNSENALDSHNKAKHTSGK